MIWQKWSWKRGWSGKLSWENDQNDGVYEDSNYYSRRIKTRKDIDEEKNKAKSWMRNKVNWVEELRRLLIQTKKKKRRETDTMTVWVRTRSCWQKQDFKGIKDRTGLMTERGWGLTIKTKKKVKIYVWKRKNNL